MWLLIEIRSKPKFPRSLIAFQKVKTRAKSFSYIWDNQLYGPMFKQTTLFLLLCWQSAYGASISETFGADIIVYGGTPSAIMAAVQAKRSGKSVIVVSPDRHLGYRPNTGMCSSLGMMNPVTFSPFTSRRSVSEVKEVAWNAPRPSFMSKLMGTVL